MRQSDLIKRLNLMKRSGVIGLLISKVANPLLAGVVAVGAALQRPFQGLRSRAVTWLSISGTAQPTSSNELNQSGRVLTRVPAGLNRRTGPISVEAALTIADRYQLALPPDMDKHLSTLLSASEPEQLEPVKELDQMRRSPTSVCFVITVDRDDPDALALTVQSVLRQTDPAWEIMLCGSALLQNCIDDWLDIDWRIRRLLPDAGSDEVQNLLRASAFSTSQFIGLLAQGDVVDDDLVKHMGWSLNNDPELDLVYTDEAAMTEDGAVISPFYKPDWSPEHQHAVHLVGRFLAIRKPLLLNLHIPGTGSREADEYALGLAVTRAARRIGHIEDVLYVRSCEHEPRPGGFFSTEGLEPARASLERHLACEHPGVTVVAHPDPGSLQVKWPIPDELEVTLLILTAMQERTVPGRGRLVLATNFVRSILEKSTFKGYRIIVVDDGHVPDDLRELLSAHGHTTCTFPRDGEFSFARKSNFATSLVRSGVVLLLNDDLEVISGDWIEALVRHAARPDVGVAGGKLLFPDGRIQHAGISTGLNGSAGHVFLNRPSASLEYGGYASVDRNWGAVTGAVMAYRKDFFDWMGGFDERFRIDYNDIDFCLRCVDAGFRVVFTPHALLYHFHNSSFQRKHDHSQERREFLARWEHVVKRDPYCGLHLRAICAEQHNDSVLEHASSS